MRPSKEDMQALMRDLAAKYPQTEFVLLAHTEVPEEQAMRQVATTTDDIPLIGDMLLAQLEHMTEVLGEAFKIPDRA